jgi:Skp family chaperone for outer membrane proteins
MRRSERVVVYTVIGLGLALGAGRGVGLFGTPAVAQGSAPRATEARIATCDVYDLANRLMESDAYKPSRDAEQKRLEGEVKPQEDELQSMDTELRRLQGELQNADPKDPASQAKFNDFQGKRQAFEAKVKTYQERKQGLSDGFMSMISRQFVEARQKVCAEAGRIARAQGYTAVLVQARGDITATNPQGLTEAFLSRPVAWTASDVDITEAVRESMKLPKAPPPEAGAGAGAPPVGTPAPGGMPAGNAPGAGTPSGGSK